MAEEETELPVHTGAGLAAVILGAACVPCAVVVGLASLAVSLPTFGVWWFLPVVAVAIMLGMFAARTRTGVAGAALGVAALLICLLFVLVDRSYGPDIRAQLRPPTAAAPNLKLEQLLKSLPPAATRPAP